MNPTRFAPLALAAGLLFAACGDGDSTPADSGAASTDAGDSAPTDGPVTVDIADFAYAPLTVTVTSGTEVTFVNADSAAHTATARDGSFNTDSIAGGAEFSVTVEGSGEIAYYCAFHPFMEATIVVE